MGTIVSPETDARVTSASPSAHGEGRAVALIVSAGFLIRIYLSLTSYCISGDGAAYIGMAREFANRDADRTQ